MSSVAKTPQQDESEEFRREVPASSNRPQPDVYGGPSQIFLAPARDRVLGRTLSRIVRMYGLDVYGTEHLGRRALFDMCGIAAMLTVIFLFDFGAWSLLFNTIVHSGLMEFTKLTFLACLAGFVFASATLIYERQFMTADVSWSAGRQQFAWVVGAICIRVSVLVAAALVTSQSMELLVFDGAIKDRGHEEAVWVEALRSSEQLKEAREKKKPLSEEELTQKTNEKDPLVKEDRRDAKSALGVAQNTVDAITKKLSDAERNQDGIRSQQVRNAQRIRRATEARDEGELSRAQAEETALRTQYEIQSGRIRSLKSDLDDANKKLKDAGEALGKVNDKYKEVSDKVKQEKDKLVQDAEADSKRERDWIHKIRRATPGVTLYEFGTGPVDNSQGGVKGRVWDDPKRHIFDKLRIIDDLRKNHPPFFPGGPDTRKIIAEEFNLGGPGQLDEDSRQQRELASDQFNTTYERVFAIAMVIPLLIFALKLLIAQELKQYYSTAYQEAMGNPEAAAHMEAMREMKWREVNPVVAEEELV